MEDETPGDRLDCRAITKPGQRCTPRARPRYEDVLAAHAGAGARLYTS
jgi:hypothetical protein